MKQITFRGLILMALVAGLLTDAANVSAQYLQAPWLANPFFLPNAPILLIISRITYWLLAVLGFIGVIAFVIAGMKYLLAFGDEKAAGEAKNAMKFSIYGILVALLGVIIIQAATTLLDGGSGF